MKHANKWLICLIIGSVCLNACAPAQSNTLTVRQVYNKCLRPKTFTVNELPKYERNLSLDSHYNLEVAAARHRLLKKHIVEQDAALTCYDNQAEGVK